MIAALSALSAACGGGGGGGGPVTAGIDAGGVRSPVELNSSITAFGSVVAGGISFNTDNAQVFINGASGLETSLQTGQRIFIQGEETDNQEFLADRIDLYHDVIGPIDSIDLSSRDLVILGQEARTDSTTAFDASISPGTLESLGEGDIVAVSGVRNAAGRLFLTRIEPATSSIFTVLATIDSVDTATSTLQLGQLSVDYSSAMVSGFAGGFPQQGDLVRVTGTRSEQGAPLEASELEYFSVESASSDEPSTRTIVEGFVTHFTSPASFAVEGVTVTTNGLTSYQYGSEADIALNVRMRVDGTRSTDDSISADSIVFRVPGTLRLEAMIDSVDTGTSSLSVAGATVFVNSDTRLEDQSSASIRPLQISSFSVGDAVEIRGFPVENGIQAISIEREDSDDDSEVEIDGFVSSLNDPFFDIAGITIATNGLTEFDDMDRTQFFSNGAGWRVEVEGALSGNTIVAEEVERDETNDGDTDED